MPLCSLASCDSIGKYCIGLSATGRLFGPSVDFFYLLRYVKLHYVYVPNPTYDVLPEYWAYNRNLFILIIEFRYDAQMSGHPAQRLWRKRCTVAQGGKSSPFSIAE